MRRTDTGCYWLAPYERDAIGQVLGRAWPGSSPAVRLICAASLPPVRGGALEGLGLHLSVFSRTDLIGDPGGYLRLAYTATVTARINPTFSLASLGQQVSLNVAARRRPEAAEGSSPPTSAER